MLNRDEPIDVLVVKLDQIKVGCLLSNIDEILPACFVTPLESAESIVEGLVNFRGEPMPVFPLRRRFGLPFRRVDSADFFLVSVNTPLKFITRVDEVIGVQKIPRTALRALPSNVAHVQSVSCDETSVILITDLNTLISSADVINLREIISRENIT